MQEAEQTKLFVGGISWETTEDFLREHFGKYGEVLGSAIAKDRNSGVPRGFAFVTFSEASAVDRALQDSHRILNRTVDVKRAIPRSDQHGQQLHHGNYSGNDHFPTKKIFVGGLPANLTEEEFRRYFEKFGSINDVVVMHDNVTHRPRGFGFITFVSEDSVEEVTQTTFHELSGKLVEVKRAIPRDGTCTGSSSNGRAVGGGRSPSFSSYQQQGAYPTYNLGFGYFPYGYGYPYGAGVYGCAGCYNGMIYRPPFAQAGAMDLSGNFFPFAAVVSVYPGYANGGSELF